MIVVDTSVWIEYFRGAALPELDTALDAGAVVLSPIVLAELLSAPLSRTNRHELSEALRDVPLHATGFDHWDRVGALRAKLGGLGVTISTPDAHVAQCALDLDGFVWSLDKVFRLASDVLPLALWAP